MISLLLSIRLSWWIYFVSLSVGLVIYFLLLLSDRFDRREKVWKRMDVNEHVKRIPLIEPSTGAHMQHYQCNVCQEMFADLHHAPKHMEKHARCPVCKQMMRNLEDLEEHLQLSHEGWLAARRVSKGCASDRFVTDCFTPVILITTNSISNIL